VVAIPEQLAAQILANPDDHEAYLVLADVLTAHGDLRGELIVASHQLLARPDDPALQERVGELLAAVRTSFDKAARFHSPSRAAQATTWHLGFVHTLRLEHPELETLRSALAHSSARFLRKLVVTCTPDATEAVRELLRDAPFEVELHSQRRSR